MARWIRLRTQVPILIISFLLSSLYRTFVRVWPLGSSAGEVGTPTHGARHGLLLLVGRQHNGSRDERGRRFVLELNSSFPFLHLQSLAPGLVSVAYSHTPCISQSDRLPQVNGMQFGFGVAPSGNQGVCSSNAGPGNQFSSNPPIPSPAINIGEPAPHPPGCAQGCGGCGGCGGCNDCALCDLCDFCSGCQCDCG